MATQRTGFDRTDTDLALTTGMDEKTEHKLVKVSSTSKSSGSITGSPNFEEKEDVGIQAPPAYDVEEGEIHVASAKDLVTQILHVEDDPTLNPWTFRMWFLGMFLLGRCVKGIC